MSFFLLIHVFNHMYQYWSSEMSLIIITPSVCTLWPWWSAAADDDDDDELNDSEVTYCPLRSVRSQAPAPVRLRASWRPGLWSQTACMFPCWAPRTAETARRRSSSVRSYPRPPAMTPCTGSPGRYESACPSPAKTHRNIKRVRLNLAFVWTLQFTNRNVQPEVLTSQVITRVCASVDSLRTPVGFLSGTGGRRQGGRHFKVVQPVCVQSGCFMKCCTFMLKE